MFGDDAQYLPVSYGQPCPEIPVEDNIFVVDFSYPKEALLELLAARIGRRKRDEYVVTVLDHHASAQRDLESLTHGEYPGLSIWFDMEESGASLTWKYLQNPRNYDLDTLEQALPTFFKYVRDRDLWRWQLPDSMAVSLAYKVIPKDMLSIAQFAQDLDEAKGYHRIVTEGQAMQRYAEALVQEQAVRIRWGMIGGYAVPFVNTTTLFSEVGDYLCRTLTEIPFCAYYFDRSDNKRQWGLRGRGKVDCSIVAKQYGGGGHHDAAGYVTEAGWLPEPTTEVTA
jgi:oligoribonuclease NrnB/cAMP/cGMP phosphodiesterase (DHH superfamily)